MEESQKTWKWGSEAESFFSKSKVWKTPFPGTLSCFKQLLTKYSLLFFKSFFQRNKPGPDKGLYTKTLYPNINNKDCTHKHLSLWAYVPVYVRAISKASNEWHRSVFGNKLITALVTLKTMADQQSAWGSSLKVVLVVVQCMRQYTENSPGCSTAKYTDIGGRRQYTT